MSAKIILALVLLLVLAVTGLYAATRILAARIEARHPPTGRFETINGVRLHFVDEGPRDAPVVLLIHGASSNLNDMMVPARAALGSAYRLIAVDRPGHGWSERGDDARTGHAWPDGQARTIAALLDRLGVRRAVVMGHSFGAAVALAVAVERPDITGGLLLAAPASHPWPSGVTNWYNHFAVRPGIGWLFTRLATLPAGIGRLKPATDCVFSPNRQPDAYLDQTGIALVLTPERFLANSIDVTNLHPHVTRYAPRYAGITAPAIIIAGGRDTVVSRVIHAESLRAQVPDSTLIEIANLGHKPDHVLAPLMAAAIRTLSGDPQDLERAARDAASMVAGDEYSTGPGCTPYDPPMAEPFTLR